MLLKKFTAVYFLLLLTQLCNAQPSFITDSLDSYIKRGMEHAQIPGLSIAIIKDGKIVVMKGFGVREVGKSDPVDENTLFMIASNSKLFTGTSLAKLDVEKKLSLDDKVTKYLPWYRVYDENVSNLITIRDLLSHHLGTKTFQGDFTFWNANLSRKDVITKMRLLKPVQQFRKDYGYCNSCFLTAGEIIPVVSGMPWEKYVEENIFKPLGMNNTYALTKDIETRKNVAIPYTNTFSPLTKLAFDKIDDMAPAGSIVSNVKDISKWLMMQLDSGRYEGKQIIPWSAIQKTRDMNTILGSRKGSSPTHIRGYGLGVFMNDYNGRMIYSHTGGADGFVTNTCFVPEERLAITILTNNDNQNFFEALRLQILNAYLGMPYVNREANEYRNILASEKETQANIKKLRDRVKGDAPDKTIDFTGTYTNNLYGNLTITKTANNKLLMKFEHHDLVGKLEYMDNNEFMTTYDPIAYGIFATKFKVENGKVKSVEIKVNDFVEYDPYVFEKK
jgi:Beta-lactamase class C and other penicillin binding proteins